MTKLTANNWQTSSSSFDGKSVATTAVQSGDAASWYEAMSKAWGKVLDAQAGKVTGLASAIADGQDNPSTMTLLTAESLKMQFMSNNAATSTNSVGQALETLARK
ncbi:hypothetical protein HDN1F_20300 [gamma proteobacterium HdN1]|nr:hypothetical protein HDN1F_20300 [gamma proteobacterium HdN1]